MSEKMTDSGKPGKDRQLNPYEVAAIKERLGYDLRERPGIHPYSHPGKISEALPPTSTPLPAVSSHTSILETPPNRGRTRESPKHRTSAQQHRRQQSRETPEPRDKRSPDVPAPDLKKIKREMESAADAEMPEFGAPTIRHEPGQGSAESFLVGEFRNSDGSTPLPAVRNSGAGQAPRASNLDASCALNSAASPVSNLIAGMNSEDASRPSRMPPAPKREPVPNPTATFDLTIDDDDDDADLEGDGDDRTAKDSQHSDKSPAGPPPLPSDELDSANAERPRHVRPSPQPAAGVGVYPLPVEAPPWIHDLHAGIMGLHNKVDLSRSEMAHFGTELQQQGVRVSCLESVSHDHTQQLQQAQQQILQLESRLKELDKIQGLEKRITDLEASRRSLTPPRSLRGGDQSPRSPRSSVGSREDSSSDLDIIVGGWVDAKRADAQQEVTNMFSAIQMTSAVKELWAPYSRTNFIKVQLAFPDEQAHISVRRLFQLRVIEKLKVMKFTSGVQGSTGNKIWATKSKSPEERARVRALVATKEFLKALPGKDGAPSIPENDIEIVWNGRLFVHQHQFLGCMDRDGEPSSEDLILSDSRGNHMPWFVKASVFEAATGYPGSELAELWEKYCPSNN